MTRTGKRTTRVRKRAKPAKKKAAKKTEAVETKALPKNKFTVEKSINTRIKEMREKKGITQNELTNRINHRLALAGGDANGYTRSSIAQWETQRARPEPKAVPLIASVLDTTPEYLEFGITGEPKTVLPDPEVLGYVLAPEMTFDDIAGQETQKWGIPVSWLKQEIGVTSLKDVIVHKIEANNDPFDYGDRVLIDRSNQRPTPPGHFLYWDGVGAIVAHMMILPNVRKHMVKITSPNGSFESELNKLQIIGRVRGVWKKA